MLSLFVFAGCVASRCLSLVLWKALAEGLAVMPGLQLLQLFQTPQALLVLVDWVQWSPGIATATFFISYWVKD